MRFAGRVAIVTGAESGIGRATAMRILSEGGSVVAVDLNSFEAWPAEYTSRVHVVRIDITDERAPARVLSALDERDWRPEILVNAAGVLRIAPFLSVSFKDWDDVLSVNLRAVFFVTQAVARRMVERGIAGRIVSVSSVHALVSEPCAAPYTASKGGLEAMTRTIASELAPHKITVNCVRPGATRTRMSDPLYTEAVLQALSQRVPLQNVAPPEWVANAICYLASDDALYTTGACLDVDGGYGMHGGLPGASYERRTHAR
jgi:NAD(P)-dependent dehydrogenase (short-subunit alcohol dehydrogenase family)